MEMLAHLICEALIGRADLDGNRIVRRHAVLARTMGEAWARERDGGEEKAANQAANERLGHFEMSLS